MPAPRIEKYAFGRITVDGVQYTSDVIVTPDGVREGWWRAEGHSLREADLGDVFAAAPEVLVIGTGAMGVMEVPAPMRELIASKAIELRVARTGKAVDLYNSLKDAKRTVAALHLTC